LKLSLRPSASCLNNWRIKKLLESLRLLNSNLLSKKSKKLRNQQSQRIKSRKLMRVSLSKALRILNLRGLIFQNTERRLIH
jgi:hypothetical protein